MEKYNRVELDLRHDDMPRSIHCSPLALDCAPGVPMKRKLAITAVVVALVLVVGLLVVVFWPRDAITQENCDRIRAGMTVREVSEVLGREPDIPARMGLFRSSANWTGVRGQ